LLLAVAKHDAAVSVTVIAKERLATAATSGGWEYFKNPVDKPRPLKGLAMTISHLHATRQPLAENDILLENAHKSTFTV
jgi:hypothetical protein